MDNIAPRQKSPPPKFGGHGPRKSGYKISPFATQSPLAM